MIYTQLQSIQTAMKAIQSGGEYVFGADGTNVVIGSDFTVNAARLPMGFIFLLNGALKNKALVDAPVIIGGIVYNESGEVYQTVLNLMELVMEDTTLLGTGWLQGPVAFNLDPEILLNIDSKYFPLYPPYGGFELEYRLNRGLYS